MHTEHVAGTTVEVRAGGPVVVKRPAEAGVAEQERTVLTLLAGTSGVVVLARPDDVTVDDDAAVVTEWVPGGSLDDPLRPRTSIAAVAALALTLARTLSVVHARQVAHARIDASHVVVDGRGEPVLVGWSHAVVGLDAPAAQPADVAALGALLRGLLDDVSDDGSAADRRATARERRALIAVADDAEQRDAGRRPTAAQLADRLGSVAPTGDGLLARPTLSNGRRPTRRIGAGIAAAAVVVVAVWFVARPASSEPPAAPTTAPRASTTTTTIVETTVAPEPQLVWPATTAPLAAEPPREIEVDGRTYRLELGSDDVVVLGDWDCDGAETAAVLRLPSGVVDRFDSWPADGEPLTAARLTATEPVASIAAGDACGPVIAMTLAGAEVTLR
jgi:hypothetical protein